MLRCETGLGMVVTVLRPKITCNKTLTASEIWDDHLTVSYPSYEIHDGQCSLLETYKIVKTAQCVSSLKGSEYWPCTC